jgi:hypothetical protein
MPGHVGPNGGFRAMNGLTCAGRVQASVCSRLHGVFVIAMTVQLLLCWPTKQVILASLDGALERPGMCFEMFVQIAQSRILPATLLAHMRPVRCPNVRHR